MKCGAWTERRSVHPRKRCSKRPTLAGRAALRRIAKGRHPVSEQLVHVPPDLKDAIRQVVEARQRLTLRPVSRLPAH
eukprot:12390438-Karenia_brevis.AAC.1